MARRAIWGAFFILGLTACGNKTANESPEIQVGDAKATLEVFAGYNCASCNVELPELQGEINKLNARGKQVAVKVYVVSGKNGKKVDQAMANQYGADLNLNFEMIPDYLCRGRYKDFYPNSMSCLVPAAVILPRTGEAIVYPPGKLEMDKFIPELKSVINE